MVGVLQTSLTAPRLSGLREDTHQFGPAVALSDGRAFCLTSNILR